MRWLYHTSYMLYWLGVFLTAAQTGRINRFLNYTDTVSPKILLLSADCVYGLSRQYDGSHHHEWDLFWAKSPIREQHIRWQIWHSKLLVDGGPDLCRSRLASIS